MTALASTDLTITVLDRRITTKQWQNRVSIAFGDGAKTYPAGGVPLPAASAFGLRRTLTTLIFTDMGSANGFLYKYDEANQKIRIYQGDNANAGAAPAVELGAVAVAALTLRGEAFGA